MGINKRKWRMLFDFVRSSAQSLCSATSPASTLLEVPEWLGFHKRRESARIKQLALFYEFNSCRPDFVFMFIQDECVMLGIYPLLCSQPQSFGSTIHLVRARRFLLVRGPHAAPWRAPTPATTPLSPFLPFWLQQTVPLRSRRLRPSDACLLQPWAPRQNPSPVKRPEEHACPNENTR